MSKKTLEDRLADIVDEAEAGEEDQTVTPIPAHVKVTRGNPRSRVLQVRLNPDEYAAIERIAERRELPASTVAREALLKLVTEEDAQDQPLVALVAAADRIKALAFDIAYPSAGGGDSGVYADCVGVRAEIRTLLDGECTPDTREMLRQHLEACPECLRYYGLEERIKGLIATKCRGEKTPEDLRERLRQEISVAQIIKDES